MEQSFYNVNPETGVKTAKGLEQTLKERGLWPGRMLKVDAAKLLGDQPDFAGQREWLAEVVIDAGHTIDYYPKFHCELNFIEKCWACAKCAARKDCDYSFASLQKLVPKVLNEIPADFFATAFRSCSRYCLAYGDGTLTPEQVRYQHKKFASHRRIGRRESWCDYK